MPELPEVETIARGLANQANGQHIVGARVLTPSVRRHGDAARLGGRDIVRVTRRAKLLQVVLDGDDRLVFHLKMTGRVWLAAPHEALPRHAHLVLDLLSGDRIVFEDMRRFGYWALFAPHELAAWPFYTGLGPEPLETDAADLADRVRTRRAGIKSLLLNQTVIAGIGNIYADESLFATRIHPASIAAHIPAARLIRLCENLQHVLRESIAAGGSTISDYRNAYGQSGIFQERFQVYGKKGRPCPGCGRSLQTATVAGRTSTHCPHCQKKY